MRPFTYERATDARAAVKAAAAWMMAPYLIWVGFASALNLAIWKMNP